MLNTGIQIPDSAVHAHKDVREKKRYAVIYHITPQGVEPLKFFPEGDLLPKDDISVYQTFKDKVFQEVYSEIIQSEKPLFVSLDLKSYGSSGRLLSKLLLILWCPEKSKIKDKMVAASTFGALGGKFNGTKKIQVNDAVQLTYEYLCTTSFQGDN